MCRVSGIGWAIGEHRFAQTRHVPIIARFSVPWHTGNCLKLNDRQPSRTRSPTKSKERLLRQQLFLSRLGSGPLPECWNARATKLLRETVLCEVSQTAVCRGVRAPIVGDTKRDVKINQTTQQNNKNRYKHSRGVRWKLTAKTVRAPAATWDNVKLFHFEKTPG